jgi:hypothetical protein
MNTHTATKKLEELQAALDEVKAQAATGRVSVATVRKAQAARDKALKRVVLERL